MKQKPNLPFWSLWNLSFGFFGVQIAYALQSANISRIFATLGADPHNLSYFWILPPLMGILVQPIVGTLSDNTWTRWGRRIPYLFIGAMQPFKMLVGDMVNEEQKTKAYSIQSFLCNAGSVVGFVFPFVLTWVGIKNVAEKGVIPDSVIWSFYLGAAILIACVIYTTLKVKEWNPEEYAEYNGNLTPEPSAKGEGSAESEDSGNWIPQLSGRWDWCSSSVGQPSSTCGTTRREPLPRLYGIQPILPVRTSRLQATGLVYSLPYKPWALLSGQPCCPSLRISNWLTPSACLLEASALPWYPSCTISTCSSFPSC